MTESLKPSRILAILPMHVSKTGHRWLEDVGRGINCYLERQFSRISGVYALLPLPTGPIGSEELGDEVSPAAGSAAFALPHGWRPTHLVRGSTLWEDEKTFHFELELIDMEARETLLKRTAEITPNREGLENFFGLCGEAARALTNSPSAGKLLSRLPTRSSRAFRLYLAGLAAADTWRHGEGDPDRPFQFLQRSLSTDGKFHDAARVFDETADLCLAIGGEERRAAVRALQRAVESVPEQPLFAGRLGLAICEGETEEKERARKLLADYVEAEPEGHILPLCYRALADLAREHDECEKAAEYLEAGLHADPQRPRDWELLGDLRAHEGSVAEAARCWRRALQEDADRPGPLEKLGNYCFERAQYQQSAMLFRRLIGIGFDSSAFHERLIQSLINAGDLESADELATTRAEEEAGNYQAWRMLAEVRLRRGDHDAAAFSLQQARAVSTTTAQAWRAQEYLVERVEDGAGALLDFAELSLKAGKLARTRQALKNASAKANNKKALLADVSELKERLESAEKAKKDHEAGAAEASHEAEAPPPAAAAEEEEAPSTIDNSPNVTGSLCREKESLLGQYLRRLKSWGGWSTKD